MRHSFLTAALILAAIPAVPATAHEKPAPKIMVGHLCAAGGERPVFRCFGKSKSERLSSALWPLNNQSPIFQSKALPLEGGNPRAARGMGFRAPLNFLEAPLSPFKVRIISWRHHTH